MKTWLHDDYGAQQIRTTASGPTWQLVVRRITRDLNTGEVLEDLDVRPSEQQFFYASIPGGPRGIRTTLHYLVRLVAPRERSTEEMQSVYASASHLSSLGQRIFDLGQWIM